MKNIRRALPGIVTFEIDDKEFSSPATFAETSARVDPVVIAQRARDLIAQARERGKALSATQAVAIAAADSRTTAGA